MKTALALVLALAAAVLAPLGAGFLAKAHADRAPVALPRARVSHLVRYHQQFPATKAALITGMRTTQEIDAGHERWLEARLPARTYHTPSQVLRALYDAPSAGAAAGCAAETPVAPPAAVSCPLLATR